VVNDQKRSSEILADENGKIMSEKVKSGKCFTESEHFFLNRGNLKQSEMHHCLRGMDAPENQSYGCWKAHCPLSRYEGSAMKLL